MGRGVGPDSNLRGLPTLGLSASISSVAPADAIWELLTDQKILKPLIVPAVPKFVDRMDILTYKILPLDTG